MWLEVNVDPSNSTSSCLVKRGEDEFPADAPSPALGVNRWVKDERVCPPVPRYVDVADKFITVVRTDVSHA